MLVVFQHIIARTQNINIARYFSDDVIHMLLLLLYTGVSVISLQFKAMFCPIMTAF